MKEHILKRVWMALLAAIWTVGWQPAFGAIPSGDDSARADFRTAPWPEDIVDMAAKIPVLENGRIKPLSTVAGFALLSMHHSRSCEDLNGEKLNPTEWMLDTLFYPKAVLEYPLFRIQTNEVTQAIGVFSEGKKKRDLYSYLELSEGRERLGELANSYSTIEPNKRTMVQTQVLGLAANVVKFERLQRFLDFARARIPVGDVYPFNEEEGEDTRRYSEIVAHGDDIADAQREGKQTSNEAVSALLSEVNGYMSLATALRLVPPVEDAEERPDWATPGELMGEAFFYAAVDERQVGMLAALEGMTDSLGDHDAFRSNLQQFDATARELAAARGEAEKVDMEVSFYKADYFTKSLVLYLLAFLMTAFTWVRQGKGLLFKSAIAVTLVGAGLQTAGIVIRCIIKGHPPVSTLYETVLFVGVTGVFVSVVIEWINRKRVAGALAPFVGALCVFIAMRFEGIKGEDTMDPLVAVLRTNFWLAVHVTCITFGYSASLLAAAFAHLHVLGKVFGYQRDNRAMYRGLAKTIYGTLCFALILSLLGTILGGIWANQSWGRFWGWDPKENGALMIVLSQLAILHARLGGILKPFGISVAVIGQGIVVAFSWWGVNQLGVGLHSYGFTDSINSALNMFYSIEGAVMALGIAWWVFSGRHGKASPAT